MRIIAGRLKNRQIKTPKLEGFRPTSERVRESLCSVLSSLGVFDGACLLELYAGSGIFSFEVLSRGGACSVLVEKNRKLTALAEKFATDFDILPSVTTINRSVESYLSQPSHGRQFSLVFADPPYDEHPGGQLLLSLLKAKCLASDAIVAIEGPGVLELPIEVSEDGEMLRFLKRRKLGDSAFWVYKFETPIV